MNDNNSSIQMQAKVEALQRTFVTPDNPTQQDISELDKRVNEFVSTMSLQKEHLQADGKDRLLNSKNISSLGTKLAVTISYLEFQKGSVTQLGA